MGGPRRPDHGVGSIDFKQAKHKALPVLFYIGRSITITELPYHHKKLSYWVIATSGLIPIGAGHGVGPIIMLELIGIIGLPFIKLNTFCFEWGCSYDQSIFAAAILIAIGQITLLIANIKESSPVRLIALGVLLYGFLFLCHNFDNMSGFTFTVSFPFLIVVCLLIFKLLQNWQYNWRK